MNIPTMDKALERQQQKARLEKEVAYYTSVLEHELAEKRALLRNAAIVGGVFLGGYLLTRMFMNDGQEKPSNSKAAASEPSVLGDMAKGMLTTAVLTIAKNQLTKLIEEFNRNES